MFENDEPISDDEQVRKFYTELILTIVLETQIRGALV
jgi:hypothetical protein